jgi:hypothetical protein
MGVSYRHTQVGYLMIAVLGILALGVAVVAFMTGAKLILVTLGAILLCVLLFPTLTTVVQGNQVTCFFGSGLIQRTIVLDEVAAVSVVQNPWFYGWGLRLIPGGSLWSVSGFDAVEVRLVDGKRFRIGTDEPHELCSALATATKPIAAVHASGSR